MIQKNQKASALSLYVLNLLFTWVAGGFRGERLLHNIVKKSEIQRKAELPWAWVTTMGEQKWKVGLS